MKSIHWWALLSALSISCGQKTSDDAASEAAGNAAKNSAEGPAPAANAVAAVAGGAVANVPRYDVPIDGLPKVGADDAKITMVELTDYDCPYCAKAESTIAQLQKAYGGDLRTVVIENPLPIHDHAEPVALFALTAYQAGVFDKAHSRLFQDQTKHSDDDLRALGLDLGMASIQRSPAALAQAKVSLAKGQDIARALQVRGTPTFFVNGRKIAGAQPFETFKAVFDEEIIHANALVAQGVAQKDLYAHYETEARQNPAPLAPAAAATTANDDATVLVAEAKGVGGLPLMGNSNAPHTVTLFTDYECPYCAKLDPKLRGFVASHPDVQVVIRQRPLPMHPNARTWATAAIAANDQGKLADFTQAAFAQKGDKSTPVLDKVAASVGIDVARMHRDMTSDATLAQLKADEAIADKLSVQGTPTSFVDGYKVIGAQPEAAFADALGRSNGLPASPAEKGSPSCEGNGEGNCAPCQAD